VAYFDLRILMTEYTNTSGLGLLSLRHLHGSSVERLRLWTNRKANKYFGKKATNKEILEDIE
jgi:hypothetical protein